MFKLSDVINECETAETSAEFNFISACLKVAYNSVGTTREKVTQEVADLLECNIEDLNFMFNDRPSRASENEIFDFPDSERRRAAIASLTSTTRIAAE